MSQATVTGRDPLNTDDALLDMQGMAEKYQYHVYSHPTDQTLGTNEHLERLRSLVGQEHFALETRQVGVVQHVGDGIAIVSGLQEAMVDELLLFPTGVYGLALSLDEGFIGCVLLGPEEGIRASDLVQSTGRVVQVPVGTALAGRVVNALGQPIDGLGPIECDRYHSVE